MSNVNLVEGWEEDMSISDSADFEYCGDNFYVNECGNTVESPNEDFVINSLNTKDCIYIHDQDMNYYQETSGNGHNDYTQDEEIALFNGMSMLGNIEIPNSTRSDENENDYDPDYDMEVNKLLEEVEEELNEEAEGLDLKENVKKSIDKYAEEKIQYEDYYDDFPIDKTEDNETPEWYDKILQKKIKETKRRLEDLSRLVCYASSSTREQIIRIEQDHNTPFCKLDYPRHPSFSKPWINYWRFNCLLRCNIDPPEPNHAHTSRCEIVLLEHVDTGISTKSCNILPNEFPESVMRTVELFQEFVNYVLKHPSCYEESESIISNHVVEKPTWSYIKIRSNYKNELMLIVCGKGVSRLLKLLRKYFTSEAGRTCNVVSLYCINMKWSQKKSGIVPPTFLMGCLELRDKIGPISIKYNPKTNINFNSIEAQQLGKIMIEYLAPNFETTIIDLGCNFGVLTLMLAQKCDKIIGLNTLEHEIKMAEEVKLYNNLHNASFIVANPNDVLTKCAPLVKKCISVAVLNLATPFGKSPEVMRALRNLPSIWRIAIYGSFTKEFHKQISLLTSRDEHMGCEFLPMQGCILDKIPSNSTGFNIIILFERKSLLEPSIELIAPGPTVNVKSSIDDFSNEDKKFKIKVKAEFDNPFDDRLKNPAYKPLLKSEHSKSNYDRLDNLNLHDESNVKGGSSSKSSKNPFASHTQTRPFNYPYPGMKIKELKKIFDCPSLPKCKEKQLDHHNSSSSSERRSSQTSRSESRHSNHSSSIKREKEHYDPPFDKVKREKYSDTSSTVKRERQHNYRSLSENETMYDYALSPPPLPSPPPSFPLLFNPPPPPPPPPETETTVVKPKVERIHSSSDKEEGELTPDSVESNSNGLPASNVKLEPMDLDNEELGNTSKDVSVKCETVSSFIDNIEPFPNVKIKSEPMDSFGALLNSDSVDSSVSIKVEPGHIKTEPIDTENLPMADLEDIENMVTPLHNPASLHSRKTPSPPPVDPNFSVDGFEFSVKPNQTYLTFNFGTEDSKQTQSEKESAQDSVVTIKQEPVIKTEPDTAETMNYNEKSPNKISIISEKKRVRTKVKKERKNSTESKSKEKDDISILEVDEADLRKLIEKRKCIQKQLDRDRDHRKSRRPRSPSSPSNRRFKSPISLSDRRHRSTNSPDRWHRSAISPSGRRCRSPTSPSGRRGRSPTSPSGRRGRSPISPSGRRRRSPISPTGRRGRSPISPTGRRGRSPISPTGRRGRSPISPTGRRGRSPISPTVRRGRSPISPTVRRGRSPISPTVRRGRSPISPTVRRVRSPILPPERRYRSPPTYVRCRSPISPGRYWSRRGQSPSPPGIKWPKRSPPSPVDWKHKYRRRSRSRSPLVPFKNFKPRSPPPPRRSPKRQSRSISRSPTSTSTKHYSFSKSPPHHKKTKISPPGTHPRSTSPKDLPKKNREILIKSEDQWDIPGLSSLSSDSSPDKQRKKSTKSAASTSVSDKSIVVVKKEPV